MQTIASKVSGNAKPFLYGVTIAAGGPGLGLAVIAGDRGYEVGVATAQQPGQRSAGQHRHRDRHRRARRQRFLTVAVASSHSSGAGWGHCSLNREEATMHLILVAAAAIAFLVFLLAALVLLVFGIVLPFLPQ